MKATKKILDETSKRVDEENALMTKDALYLVLLQDGVQTIANEIG